MNNLNMDITVIDRYIKNLLPSSLGSSSISTSTMNSKEGIESLKILINALNEMSSCLGNTTQRLKEFEKGVEAGTLSEKAAQLKTSGIESLKNFKGIPIPKKESNGLSKTFNKNIDGLKNIGKLDKDAFGKIAAAFKGLSGMFPNDESTTNIMKWTEGLGNAATEFAKGNPLAGLVNIGSTISSIISASRKAEKEIKKFYNELEQAAINYSVKVIAAAKDIKSANDSIFDTDTANRLVQGMAGFNDAQSKLAELENRLYDENIQTGKKKKRFLGFTTGTKTYWGSVMDNYQQILKTNEKLIDADGKLNMSIANSLKESGKLSTEAATTINNMIAVQTAADAAMKQVNETLTATAGSMGSDLQTALVSAFRDGTNAAKDFSKSVSEILNGIITDQLFNNIFGDMLKDLEKRMQGSFSQGGDQDLTDDVVWFYTGYQGKVDKYNEALKKIQEQLNQVDGLNILGSTKQTDQSSSKGGFAAMSQDTAGELNGRFTAVQMHTKSIDENLKAYMEIQSVNKNTFSEQANSLLQLCSVNVQSMYHLEDIKKNTNQLHDINDKLGVIQQNTSRL